MPHWSTPDLFELTPADVPAVTAVHVLSFETAILTRLGPGAVDRYYRWQFEAGHDADLLGARVDGDLVGFVLGGHFNGAVRGFVRRNWPYLLWAGARHPLAVVSALGKGAVPVIQRSLRPEIDHTPAVLADRLASYGILAMAVHPDHQGSGVADVLIDAAEERARGHRRALMRLTVATGNRRAIAFYERHGWRRVPGADGVWAGRMEKPLTGPG